MRSLIIVLLTILSAAAQPSVAGNGMGATNTTGRSVIPEKFGVPLKERLISSDVRLGKHRRDSLPAAQDAPRRSRPK